jgi:general secretion pathway protein I
MMTLVAYDPGQLRFRRAETSSHCAENNAAGFTLVEVIVAIAILSLALGVLLNAISGGLRTTSQAERMAEAGSLAQSLLAQVGTELPIRPGQSTGEFPDGFRWRLSMQSFGDATEREVWPVGAYTISAEVSWDDGAPPRSYALTTLRLGPKDTSR